MAQDVQELEWRLERLDGLLLQMHETEARIRSLPENEQSQELLRLNKGSIEL
jgi:hypothetical protein